MTTVYPTSQKTPYMASTMMQLLKDPLILQRNNNNNNDDTPTETPGIANDGIIIQNNHSINNDNTTNSNNDTTILVVDRNVPMIGYVILLTGLFALASVGAALDLQQGGVTPTMKTVWRQMATSLCLLPMVIKSIYYDGMPNLDIVLLPIAAVTYTYTTTSFVLALQMTTLANAFVLSNLASLVIIVGRFLLGLPVLRAEGIGAMAGFVGAAICADDAVRSLTAIHQYHSDTTSTTTSTTASATTTTTGQSHAMWGNIMALSGSFGTAGYLIIAKTLRPKMDLFVFMFSIMSLGGMLLLLLLILQQKEDITFDMHPVHGIFGWLTLSPDRLPLELYMALVCNGLGTTGYVAVMKYFSPLVPATVMLLEPLVGALLGAAAGTAPLPGVQTWLGDIVVAGGTFLVIWAEAQKTERTVATTEDTTVRSPRIGPEDAVIVSPYVRAGIII